MRMGVDYSFMVEIRQYRLRLRPLSIKETVEVAASVSDKIRSLPDTMKRSLTESVLLAKETIKVASTSDVGVKDERITDMIMDQMTPDEMQFLFNQYTRECEKCNPSVETMSSADILALVADIKKKSGTPEALALQLIGLSHLQSFSLIHYLLSNVG